MTSFSHLLFCIISDPLRKGWTSLIALFGHNLICILAISVSLVWGIALNSVLSKTNIFRIYLSVTYGKHFKTNAALSSKAGLPAIQPPEQWETQGALGCQGSTKHTVWHLFPQWELISYNCVLQARWRMTDKAPALQKLTFQGKPNMY